MLKVFLLLLSITISNSQDFLVHRAIQFDVNDASYGSRSSVMELKAATNPGILQPKLKKNGKPKKFKQLNRKCVVVTMKEATKELLEHLIDTRRVGGLLIVVPEDTTSLSTDVLNNWRILESWIISRELKVPLFFTIESTQSTRVIDFIEKSKKSSDDYLLKVRTKASKKMNAPSLQNVQGWIAGESKDVDSEHLPTIAVIGHYDSFGIAPGLAKGGGSQAVAVLELARLFSKAYKKEKGEYNLLFVLTAGGHMNYAGARDWLEMLDVSLMDSIDFVICLENLDAATNELHLHHSKNPNDKIMKRISTAFENSIKNQKNKKNKKNTLTLHRKKIQIKNPHLAWQHEQFAMKRIVGVTLSSSATPSKLFARSSHFVENKSVKQLSNIITVIANAISSIVYSPIYGTEEIEVEQVVEIDVEESREVEDDSEEDSETDPKKDPKKDQKKDQKKTKKSKKTKKMKTVTRIVKKKVKKMIKKTVEKQQARKVSLKVDETYVATWSKYMSKRARVAPFMSKDNAVDLEKALKSSLKETSLQTFVLEETGGKFCFLE